MGTYEHPPETKDITDMVTWSVDFAESGYDNRYAAFVTAVSICGSGNLYGEDYSDSPNLVSGTCVLLRVGGIGTSSLQSGRA